VKAFRLLQVFYEVRSSTVWGLATAIHRKLRVPTCTLAANVAVNTPKCVYAVLHRSHSHATAFAAAAGTGVA
jgi:hypothetical protein